MTDTTTNKLFQEEAERMADGYKTGSFKTFRNWAQHDIAEKHGCGCLGAGMVWVDWYMTRTAERNPVIRVKWFFPTQATRKVVRNGYYTYKKTWECGFKEQKFPFTEDGLNQALAFADTL